MASTTEQKTAFYESSIDLKRELAPKPGDVVRVPSRRKADTLYAVAIALDGSTVCNCPASYNHLDCWHAKYVQEEMMMTTETAVALRPVTLSPTLATLPSEREMSLIDQAAKLAFAGAVALPKELNTPQKVAAVMLYGWELGLKPMTAIRHLYIVNQRIAPSAEVMAALLMRAEPDARIEIAELTDERCTMRLIRPARGVDNRYTVTWDEIKRAGLARDNNLLYPRDRLRYHCTKRLLRTYAPDAINNLEGPVIDGSARVLPEGASEDELYNEGDEPQDGEYRNVDTETGEIDPQPQTAPAAVAKPPAPPKRKPDAMTEFRAAAYAAGLNAETVIAESQRRYGNREPAQLTQDERQALLAALIAAKEPAPATAAACEHEPTYDSSASRLFCVKCGAEVAEDEPAVGAAQPSLIS